MSMSEKLPGVSFSVPTAACGGLGARCTSAWVFVRGCSVASDALWRAALALGVAAPSPCAAAELLGERSGEDLMQRGQRQLRQPRADVVDDLLEVIHPQHVRLALLHQHERHLHDDLPRTPPREIPSCERRP
eukprot:scaffold2529_cov363-Prasinococcus_capsulatus_cf.AAC.9